MWNNRRASGLIAACLMALMTPAVAEISGGVVRIGVANDQSGPYADVGGPGSAVAARLAVEDFGGSILGKPIEIVAVDHQNKPDIASRAARQWFEVDGVDAIVDGAGSSAAMAIQELARTNKKAFLITGAASSDFTGKLCSPTSIHWTYDTYALANGTGKTLVKHGGDTWFFVTADYAFGHALERDTGGFVKDGGGKVIGSVRHPLNTADFSSFVLQAQASKAKVIGLANAGLDTVNAIKQAAEFGLVSGGQRLAGLLLFITDIQALGLKTAQGLVLTTSFYWDMDDATRKWTKRFMEKTGGKLPTMIHAGTYGAVLHYLRAIEATKTDDATTVVAKMKELPINNFYMKNNAIRKDGRVLNTMYLVQVKSPAESKYAHDYYKVLASVPGQEAFRPINMGACPMVTN